MRMYRLRERVHFHAQNLNEDENGKRAGSMFWYGRAWLTILSLVIHPEWSFGKRARSCGMDVSIGYQYSGAPGIGFHIAIPRLFNLFLILEWMHPLKWMPEYERTTGCWYESGVLWLELWHFTQYPELGFHRAFHIQEWLIGKRKYTEVIRQVVYGNVHMQEGYYPVKVTLITRYWHYPRWFTHSWNSADIDLFKPIPVPVNEGIEELTGNQRDGIYSMGCNADTFEDAMSKLKAAIERERKYHGWDY